MPTLIAHFTDIHFTEDPRQVPRLALLSKRILGWVNLRYRGRYSAFEQVEAVAKAFLADLEVTQPDSILFTGDITSLALESEFQMARETLASLLEDPRMIGIPGNHDVYVPSAQRRRLFEASFPQWTRTDLPEIDFPSEHAASYPYPLLRLVGDDVAILAVRDVRAGLPHDSSGRLPAHQMRALESILSSDAVAGRTVILAMHYCLLRADGSRDKYLHRLRNDEQVLALAERNNISLIVCGHVHHRGVLKSGQASPVPLANPGSLSYYKESCAYHLISVEGSEISLKARRYDKQRGCFEAWDEAPGCGVLTPS
jgi:3',5'-cyclic AMP phosphodiesterase CpdA